MNDLSSPQADDHFSYSTTLRRTVSRSSFDHYSGGLLPTAGVFTREPVGLMGKLKGFGKKIGLGGKEKHERSEGGLDTVRKETIITPSEKYAGLSVEDTLKSHRPTSASTGLPGTLLDHLRMIHGPNEFQVAESEHIALKFAKQIYENPLILLLLGSAGVSLLVGNRDDAISIAIAVMIVLTGVWFVSGEHSLFFFWSVCSILSGFVHFSWVRPRTTIGEILRGPV